MAEGRSHKFRTPSGGVSADYRHAAKKAGDTLPGTDKFPIRNARDLENAKHDIGRTSEPKDKVRAYINREARKLGEPTLGETKEHPSERRYKRMR